MTWQITSASEPGTSHVRRGLRCQDAYASWQDRVGGIAVLAVADGAGSARRASDGARIAVATAVEACTRRLTASAHGVPESVKDWEVLLRNTLEAVRHEIERVAAGESDAVVAPSATAASDGIGTQRTTEGRATNHEAATPVSATHPRAVSRAAAGRCRCACHDVGRVGAARGRSGEQRAVRTVSREPIRIRVV